MEPLEIFDSINNKHINVYVTADVAEKCRTDNIFAQDLFNKLQDQNIEEGSAVEIETIKTENETETVEESVLEEKTDKETWSRRDTLKLIKVYQKNKSKFNEYRQRKLVWIMIAKELSVLNVHKSPEKCAEKWKNLLRTYRSANERPFVPTRFQYYQEINDIFNNTQVTLSDTDSDDLEGKQKPTVSIERSMSPLDQELRDEPLEKEFWSRYETLKLLKAYQKHKNLRKSFAKEKQFWMVISAELAKDNIQKPMDKCATKWKNLFRSYKRNVDKSTLPSRFQYFQEVSDVMNDIELFVPDDNNLNIPDDVDFEKILDPDQFKCFLEESDFDSCPKDVCSWTADETLKLIKAYKKHKHRFKKCPTKKYVWAIIAAELTEGGVQRDVEKCENKWKSLMRSYKRGSKSTESPRFYFFDEMCEVLKDDDLLNDGEVSTTQNDISLVNDKESLENTNYPDNVDLEHEDDETEHINYEEIIIETESDKPDETDNKYWSYNETSGLLKAYARHRSKFKETKKKMQVWEEISQELETLHIYKSPESCEKKWKSMFTVYKTHKLNKTGPGKFSFYREIDDMFKEKSEILDSDENVVHNKKCKCMEKRMLEKQRRHIERMQLLKRKLDLEERKVKAFEFYVKHLKSSSS